MDDSEYLQAKQQAKQQRRLMDAGCSHDGEYLQYLRAKQQRKLMAASFFALKLPMQEIVGSPSSSTTTKTTSPRWEQISANEIAGYGRELVRRDRELAELEATKRREDMNVHDQNFSFQFLNVPEAWTNTGDYLERPYWYVEGSTPTWTAGNFRVYCKGLVTETVVGNHVLQLRLAGVGVVICNTKGRQIFKLRKPLELVADVDADDDICVEFKALVEGLKAALALGLQRVHVLFDNNLLYRYVTGKGPPRKNWILRSVDQVSVLQKKFVSCDVSLAGPKKVRFASKLARDAIVSRATHHGKILLENCIICTEDTDVRKIFSIDNCLHEYCFSCIGKHIKAKLLQGKLPKCPHEGCKTEMKIQSCETFLTPELYGIMSELVKEASIPVTDKIYCPYPTCSALMSIKQVIDQHVHFSRDGQQAGARTCMKCHGIFCINCKVPWHVNMTCINYKKKNPHLSKEDAKLKSLAKKSLWRQCEKCSHMVELAHGCYHIYCRCGHEFCYTCGAEWKNKKATCKCLLWDERNIVNTEQNAEG